jgi:ribulose-5-phosphate 4-epimerase/fuculose-1-phosphate aldolase
MKENQVKTQIVEVARSLFDRGYTAGGSGNISVRLTEGFLMTPTGSCMGRLDADRISHLDNHGNLLEGAKPSKEWLLHKEVYEARSGCGAVVHLHSSHAVAVSCLNDLNPEQVLPPLTPYYVMRVGQLALLPYFPPGDQALAQAVGRAALNHGSILLAHHGTVVAGKDLEDAVYTSEELEETARLYLLLKGNDYNTLDLKQIEELNRRFGAVK